MRDRKNQRIRERGKMKLQSFTINAHSRKCSQRQVKGLDTVVQHVNKGTGGGRTNVKRDIHYPASGYADRQRYTTVEE